MNDFAQAEWTPLCRVADLVPDRPRSCQIGDTGQARDHVCVVAHDDVFMALLDRCPHRDIALSGGIVRDGELVCPGHFWRFDLATGRRVDEPACALTHYDTRVVDGWVEAQIPQAEPRKPMRDWLLDEASQRGRGAGTG